MAHDVFVSYPHADKPVADAVVNRLETDGIRCWIAPRDVPRGADWAGSIINAIETCRLEVLVFSDATNDSDHILREVRAAGDNNIPILPFRTTDQQPNAALRYYIGGTHWLDAYTDTLDHHLTELTTSVRAILDGTQPAPAPTPTTTTPPTATTHDRSGLAARWRQLPSTAKIGAAAVAALAIVAGIIIATRGSDDTPTTTEPAIAADEATTDEPAPTPTEPAPVATDVEAEPLDDIATATPPDDEATDGSSGDETSAGSAAETPSDDTPGVAFSFAIAGRGGPNPVCTVDRDLRADCELIDGERWSEKVATADFNGDGRTDVAFGNSLVATDGSTWIDPTSLARDRVCLAADDGWDCRDITDDEHHAAAIAAADFDADGNHDLVIASGFSFNPRFHPNLVEICLGDGAGGFACSTFADDYVGVGDADVADIAVVDIDADGDLDLALAVRNVFSNLVCLGDGRGAFACSVIDDDQAFTSDVVAADFAGGPSLDLTFNNGGPPNRLCVNQDDATFACSDISEPLASGYTAAAFPAVAGDGYAEMLVAQWGEEPDVTPDGVVLCLNDGSGEVACSPADDFVTQTFTIVVDDFDGDGNADHLRTGDITTLLCLGDGTGGFDCRPIQNDNDSLPSPQGADIALLSVMNDQS